MAVGTGGGAGGGGQFPPPYLANLKPKKFKSIEQRYINHCIEIWLKYIHSSVDIGNHRYINVQNCILLKYKCVLKKIARQILLPPPPHPKIIPTALGQWDYAIS